MRTEPVITAEALTLEKCIQTFDAALTPEFCAEMIRSFNELSRLHIANGRSHKPGLDGSAWTELDISPLADAGFKGFFYQQIDEYLTRYNRNLGLTLPVPLRPNIEALRIKRYRTGANEQFEPHFDALDDRCNRYLVFLWYLNDVSEGGETEFQNLGIKVQARVGRLLMFPPYWMFQHAGLPPISNNKYIVSTYLLFS
jgi:prolyl 4-hydroxylase